MMDDDDDDDEEGAEDPAVGQQQMHKHSEAENYWHSEAQFGRCRDHVTCQGFGCFKYPSCHEEHTRNVIQHVW